MSAVPAGADRSILLINPNTSGATTELLVRIARGRLRGTGVSAVGVTAARGPRMLTEPEDLRASIPEVLAAARRAMATRTVSAVLVGAIGDPGTDELRTELDVPVLGIGEAAVREAARGDGGFGMITTTPALATSLGLLARRHAGHARFTGVRVTRSAPLRLAAAPDRQLHELEEALQLALADGARRIVVAGGPLSSTARQLADRHPGVVVQPVPAGVDALLRALDRLAAPGTERALSG
jgi:allantoin racemase